MELKSHFDHRTVLKRMATLFLVGAAAVAFQGVAFAHHLTVTATASCSNGAPVISYTVTSWATGFSGENPEIEVMFNGVTVDMEAFLDTTTPSNQFSGTKPAPAATNTVDVEAVAAVAWADGYPSGQTSTVTVTIPTNCAPGTGRFTGGGKQIVTVSGLTITYGFEVDCDLHQPSNNLGINWNGNQFHMTDFTSAVCTLQGNPKPPKAPVNTIMGVGTGRYDGTDGYTVLFELVDNGEPGTSDESSFVVYQTSNPSNVVLNLPLQFITSGNIQAHVDQK